MSQKRPLLAIPNHKKLSGECKMGMDAPPRPALFSTNRASNFGLQKLSTYEIGHPYHKNPMKNKTSSPSIPVNDNTQHVSRHSILNSDPQRSKKIHFIPKILEIPDRSLKIKELMFCRHGICQKIYTPRFSG